MTTERQNLTIYNEKDLITAIEKFQKKEDNISFTLACTKLLKKALRKEGLLPEIKI